MSGKQSGDGPERDSIESPGMECPEGYGKIPTKGWLYLHTNPVPVKNIVDRKRNEIRILNNQNKIIKRSKKKSPPLGDNLTVLDTTLRNRYGIRKQVDILMIQTNNIEFKTPGSNKTTSDPEAVIQSQDSSGNTGVTTLVTPSDTRKKNNQNKPAASSQLMSTANVKNTEDNAASVEEVTSTVFYLDTETSSVEPELQQWRNSLAEDKQDRVGIRWRTLKSHEIELDIIVVTMKVKKEDKTSDIWAPKSTTVHHDHGVIKNPKWAMDKDKTIFYVRWKTPMKYQVSNPGQVVANFFIRKIMPCTFSFNQTVEGKQHYLEVICIYRNKFKWDKAIKQEKTKSHSRVFATTTGYNSNFSAGELTIGTNDNGIPLVKKHLHFGKNKNNEDQNKIQGETQEKNNTEVQEDTQEDNEDINMDDGTSKNNRSPTSPTRREPRENQETAYQPGNSSSNNSRQSTINDHEWQNNIHILHQNIQGMRARGPMNIKLESIIAEIGGSMETDTPIEMYMLTETWITDPTKYNECITYHETLNQQYYMIHDIEEAINTRPTANYAKRNGHDYP